MLSCILVFSLKNVLGSYKPKTYKSTFLKEFIMSKSHFNSYISFFMPFFHISMRFCHFFKWICFVY